MNRALFALSASDRELWVRSALLAAESACQARKVQLTPTRKAVLRTLWQAGQPLGAYDLLKRLGDDLDRHFSPPTIYRALDFLLEQRLILRIESRNVFVPCAHPDHPHASIFFICKSCGLSEEIEDSSLEKLFDRKAASLGFRVSRRVFELQGVCANCREALKRASVHAF